MTAMERDAPRFASGSEYSAAKASRAKLVHVVYKDHVLFKKMEMRFIGPVTRETVGWIIAQDDESITIVHDRSFVGSDGRRDRTPPCGLLLLRVAIESIQELTHG